MSDRSSQGEPTMEEILASIRKIISEDDPGTEPPTDADQAAAGAKQGSEDILELTERIEDDHAAPAETTSADDAEIDAILASVTGSEDMGRTDTGVADERSAGIASSETERAVTSALSEFAGALMEQHKDQEGPIGGNQSLDALVRSAIEPYLKSWLDQHLEALVERVLKEELGRMARRAENL